MASSAAGNLKISHPTACVHVGLLQDVSEEGAVRLRITAVQDEMAAIDHELSLRG